MHKLKYKLIHDSDNLHALSAYYPPLAPIAKSLRNSYKLYIKRRGFQKITPINIGNDEKDCLEKAYKNHPAAAKLQWIEGLYLHGMLYCPMCGGSGARTLDHYLPQAHYPEFSVLSLNLIPSCGICNGKRNACNSPEKEHKTLHLYFDKNILNKLEPITKIQVTAKIPYFSPVYNRDDFTEAEQVRIDEHFERSIDTLHYLNYNLGQLDAIKARASGFKTAKEARTLIEAEKKIYEMTNCNYSWGGMMCSGLLKLQDSELHDIIIATNAY